mmetsp:Transcript_91265/g.144190  ORF Transcript_91265/g.144190 Transcript_91265/m.144190 type:complete len:91 (+) Transcript_91265:490-762(+)
MTPITPPYIRIIATRADFTRKLGVVEWTAARLLKTACTSQWLMKAIFDNIWPLGISAQKGTKKTQRNSKTIPSDAITMHTDDDIVVPSTP